MYQRLLNLSYSRSFFLFGARGTGKTELLKHHFPERDAHFIDLLNPELSGRLLAYPNELLELINVYEGDKKWIVIDEVQKIPAILDLVHQQIGEKKFLFALTGSSARKLKRGSANLLAGRASVFHLFPLTHTELGEDFDLDTYLTFGGLPEVWNIPDALEKKRFLKAYSQTYLKEEIVAEQIVRNLPPFKRFLDIVGRETTNIVNYTNIAKDISSDAKAVSRYYEILEDTLLGMYLPSYHTSIRKQQKKSKRFYFFDPGIARVLAGTIDNPIQPKTYEYGQMFENFIVQEIHRLLTYSEKQFQMSFLRVSDTQEIDLIVEKSNGDTFLCEIKSTKSVNDRYAQSLNTLAKDFSAPRLRLISQDPAPKKLGNTRALFWKEAIKEICDL